MFSVLLSIHIGIAALFAVVLLVSAYAVSTGKTKQFRPLAAIIAALAVIEIGSGAMLSISSSEGIMAMCAKAGVYLFVAGVAEYVLLRQKPQLVTQVTE